MCTNVSGSFALGVVLMAVVRRFPPTSHLHPFVATGFLGAYTTFSTFALETAVLARGGRAGLATVYAVTSLTAGVAAAWGGLSLGRTLLPARPGDPQ
ncbi:MAG: CrcB family protein [Acidimicrobiia bacterium]|nr:CrcB family protein [Acidimicrobiia bacterium]